MADVTFVLVDTEEDQELFERTYLHEQKARQMSSSKRRANKRGGRSSERRFRAKQRAYRRHRVRIDLTLDLDDIKDIEL